MGAHLLALDACYLVVVWYLMGEATNLRLHRRSLVGVLFFVRCRSSKKVVVVVVVVVVVAVVADTDRGLEAFEVDSTMSAGEHIVKVGADMKVRHKCRVDVVEAH